MASRSAPRSGSSLRSGSPTGALRSISSRSAFRVSRKETLIAPGRRCKRQELIMSASTLSLLTLLAGASALAGMASLPVFAQGGSIKVATWGGSWRDSLDKTIGEKIRAAGGSVDYVVDTPQGNLAKLVAARGPSAPFD